MTFAVYQTFCQNVVVVTIVVFQFWLTDGSASVASSDTAEWRSFITTN